MTTRKPLVIVSGLQQELPAGDNIITDYIAAANQLTDFAGTDIADVDAATKAMRGVLYPDDWAAPAGWAIGRYSLGQGIPAVNLGSQGTNAAAGGDFIQFLHNATAGFTVVKKVNVSHTSGPVVGTRAGTTRIDMYLVFAVTALGGQSLLPGSLGTGSGLLSRQQSPICSFQTQLPGSAALGAQTVQAIPFASLSGAINSNAGCPALHPTDIFDYRKSQQPLILGDGWGFVLRLTNPAAVTSQSISAGCTIRWDEWMPIAPDGFK
jgi:hypothetical protein